MRFLFVFLMVGVFGNIALADDHRRGPRCSAHVSIVRTIDSTVYEAKMGFGIPNREGRAMYFMCHAQTNAEMAVGYCRNQLPNDRDSNSFRLKGGKLKKGGMRLDVRDMARNVRVIVHKEDQDSETVVTVYPSGEEDVENEVINAEFVCEEEEAE